MKYYAKCPFYIEEKNRKLICEAKTISFPSKEDRRFWLKLHCCSWNYKFCKFYKEHMKKYYDI